MMWLAVALAFIGGFGFSALALSRRFYKVTLHCGVCTRVIAKSLIEMQSAPLEFQLMCVHCADENAVCEKYTRLVCE